MTETFLNAAVSHRLLLAPIFLSRLRQSFNAIQTQVFAAGGGAAAAAAFDDDEREKGKKAAEEKEQEDAQRYKMAFDRIMKIVGVTADTSSNLVSLILVNVHMWSLDS